MVLAWGDHNPWFEESWAKGFVTSLISYLNWTNWKGEVINEYLSEKQRHHLDKIIDKYRVVEEYVYLMDNGYL
ncbi:MAG: hypothetical protein DRQ88_12995 [Epsilonproteobacteria bacterium]|nr:MAG: hypothetical protein DRQ88_12995 [Campylobacterota bacterium]